MPEWVCGVGSRSAFRWRADCLRPVSYTHLDVYKRQYMKGDNSPSISKDNIENWLYPVPPVEEQKMICVNLQAAFALIEDIEKSLN